MKSCQKLGILLVLVSLPFLSASCFNEERSASQGPAPGPASISRERPSNSNLPAVYVSARDADRATRKIVVTGVGIPPTNAASASIRREMAERAALSDGERKLIQRIGELGIGPKQSLRSKPGERNFSRNIQGYIKGYRIVGERQMNDGRIEIDLELPLDGLNGLPRRQFD